MDSFSALYHNALGLKFTSLSVREAVYLDIAPTDIYMSEDDIFKIVFREGMFIDSAVLRDLINSNNIDLFVEEVNYYKISEKLQDNLRKITRSLSIGDPLTNAIKQANILTITLADLYEDPTDNAKLTLQFQSVKNMVLFLSQHPKIHADLYKAFTAKRHHYIYAQPFLSSLFVLGILQQSKLLSLKELESLFLTSYFKDFGMCTIPIEKYNEPNLSDKDKKLFSKHPDISVSLLSGRVPLAPSYLKIIKAHHTFSLLTVDEYDTKEDYDKFIGGFETMVIAVSDIIAAMISERPYRNATSLFDALELVKVLIAESYPQEFKYIVLYFRQFFKNV